MPSRRETEDIVAQIEALRSADSGNRSVYEQAWYENFANFLGFQWLTIDGDTDDLTFSDLEEDVRFRSNIIQPNIAHRVAKLTKGTPDWDVDSEIDSVKVQESRNIAEKYLEYIWDEEDLQSKSKELLAGSSICGTSFFFPYWNPNAGTKLDPDEFISSQEEIPGLIENVFDGDIERTKRFLRGEGAVYSGAVSVRPLLPFCVHCNTHAASEEDLQWVIIQNVWNVNEIEKRFGKRVDPEDLSDRSGAGYLFRIRSLVSPNVHTGATDPTELKNSAMLYEYYERSSVKHPRGRFVVYANGETLYDGDNPHAHTSAEIPIVRYRDVVVPGRFFGQAAMEQIIPHQRHINKTFSDIIRNQHDHASIKWLAARGMGLKPGALDRSSREVLEFNLIQTGSGQMMVPQRIQPGVVPNWIFKILELSYDHASEIMGTHEVSKGSAPAGVESGVAIQLLQAADDTQIGSILQEVYSGHARLGRMILDILISHSNGDMVVFREIMTDGGHGEQIEFDPNKLNPRSVRVRIGSIQTGSRIGQKQLMMEAIQYGLINPADPVEKKLALNVLGFSSSVKDPNEVHRRRARSNVAKCEMGINPQIYPWTNILIEKEVIEQRMSELDFETLPQNVKQAMIGYWQGLLQLAQANATIAGGGMPPGQGPQPPSGQQPLESPGGLPEGQALE